MQKCLPAVFVFALIVAAVVAQTSVSPVISPIVTVSPSPSPPIIRPSPSPQFQIPEVPQSPSPSPNNFVLISPSYRQSPSSFDEEAPSSTSKPISTTQTSKSTDTALSTSSKSTVSPSSTVVASQSSNNESTPNTGLSTAAVGAIIGSLAFILLFGFVGCWIYTQKKMKSEGGSKERAPSSHHSDIRDNWSPSVNNYTPTGFSAYDPSMSSSALPLTALRSNYSSMHRSIGPSIHSTSPRISNADMMQFDTLLSTHSSQKKENDINLVAVTPLTTQTKQNTLPRSPIAASIKSPNVSFAPFLSLAGGFVIAGTSVASAIKAATNQRKITEQIKLRSRQQALTTRYSIMNADSLTRDLAVFNAEFEMQWNKTMNQKMQEHQQMFGLVAMEGIGEEGVMEIFYFHPPSGAFYVYDPEFTPPQ